MRRGVSAVPPTTLLLVVLLAVLAVGCTRQPERQPVTEDPRRPTITIASFDFPESELLAQLYGQALAQHGFPVEQVVPSIGTRRRCRGQLPRLVCSRGHVPPASPAAFGHTP